ncbi:hypothetical protein [Telluribacter sp.]|jgi:hypothetical protein|uniref:hypothetical protein n=1 Tax=Telluribacter sp. TaxID=1978767 RepID=UPI002E0F98E9|nr:hypothetical protein [Telluribacter sp.]
MKNFNYFRCIPVLMLLLVASLSACEKNKEIVAPDAATTVAGQYTYSELNLNGKTLPASQTDLKGTVSLTRETATSVTMVLNIRMKSDNSEFLVDNLDETEVVDLGSGLYSLRLEGQEFAQIKDKKLTIKGVDTGGVSFSIAATK